MSIELNIRTKIKSAIKTKDEMAKNILRLALGEIQTQSSRGKDLSEQDKENIVKKLVKSNETTIGLSTNEEQKQTLINENEILQSLLPKTMTYDEIKEIMEANDMFSKLDRSNVGKSMGIVMKALKAKNVPMEPRVVKEVIEKWAKK